MTDIWTCLDLVAAAIVTAASPNLAAIVSVATLISHKLLVFTTVGLAAILFRSAFVLAAVFLGGGFAFKSHQIMVGTTRPGTERNRNR